MYKIAVFDIDKTLTTEGDMIPQSALRSIKLLKENGIDCIIATARCRKDIENISKITGIKNYIANNGQYVVYDQEVLYSHTYPENIKEEVIGVCENINCYYGFSSIRGIFISDIEKVKIHYPNPLLSNTTLLQELDIQEDIEAIILFAPKNQEDLFANLKSKYILGPWGDKIFDVLKKDRSKAKGIEEIAGKLDIKRNEIICFGDGLNDIEMIEYAGLGIAMGDSKKELKKIADHITDTAENDGIYKACKKFNLL
jgi:Cof subfamily protein (haloacid dehalogenase superfamily)